MPRIPTYAQPVVAARPMPAPQLAYQNINAPKGAFDNGAAGFIEGGRQLGALAVHAERMVEEDARTHANEALTAFENEQREALWHKDDAFFRQSGRTAYDGYPKLGPMLEEMRQKHGANLSERARALYDQRTGEMVGRSLDAGVRHAARGREEWRDGTTAGLVKTNIDNAALYGNDPVRREGALQTARNAVLELAAERGWDPDDPRTQAQLRDIDSHAAVGVVKRMVETNPLEAKRYFEANSGKLSPEAYASVSHLVEVKSKKHTFDATYAAIKGMRPEPTALPDTKALAKIIIHTESSGKPVGKNPDPDSTATGTAQFVNGTWLETMRASRPDLTDGKSDPEILALRLDPVLSAEMTEAYIATNAKRLQNQGIEPTPPHLLLAHRFGAWGASALLSAAPGTFMAAVLTAKAMRDNPDLKGKTVDQLKAWAVEATGFKTERAIKQTDVRSSPVPASPPSKAAMLEFQLEQAKRIKDPELSEDIQTTLMRDYNRDLAVETLRRQEAESQAFEMIFQGKHYRDIPADIQKEIGFLGMQNIKKAYHQEENGPVNLPLYNELQHQMAEDPLEFVQRDLTALAGKMPNEQILSFMKLQGGISRKDAAVLEKGEQWKRIFNVAKFRLQAAGINPSPKEKDETGAKRMEAFQGLAVQEVEAAMKEKGGRLTDEEIGKVVDRLLTKGRIQDSGWFSDDEKFLFERKPGEGFYTKDYDDIPERERIDIILEFKSINKTDPTHKEIEEIYAARGGR